MTFKIVQLLFLSLFIVGISGARVQKVKNGLTWANRAWGLGKSRDKYSDKDVILVDMFDTSKERIARYKRENDLLVLCYISVGTVERWRPDVKKNQDDWDEIKGLQHSWEGEHWIDIVNKQTEAKKLMRPRFTLAQEKGCDGIEGDNMDCYQNKCIKGGEKRSKKIDAQLKYDRWLASLAHSKGMSMGLKNSLDLITKLVKHFDWAMNEQCVEYDECHYYLPFKKAGKAIFGTEYGEPHGKIRKTANKYGMITKNEKNGKWIQIN